MSAPAVARGQLVDVRNVNAHKCIRLIIDIPAELAPQVIGSFGWPTMVNPVPVAIARLTEEASPEPRPAPSSPTKPDGAPKTYAKRLGIACGEPAFWRFLETRLPRSESIKVTKEDEAADAVRFLCGVKSRTETVEGTPAGEKARALLADYRLYMSGAVA